MPSKPDMPCAGCGKLMWRSRTSRPQGAARCRACQRAESDHGSTALYKRGCRCPECRAAQSEANRRNRERFKEKYGFSPSRLRKDGWKGGWIAETVRQAVYERDGFVCQLCGDPTNPDGHYNDNDYPSLDHIVPLSLGGAKRDPDNLRTAHRACNSARGNRVEGELWTTCDEPLTPAPGWRR